jgi:hypothetical protein
MATVMSAGRACLSHVIAFSLLAESIFLCASLIVAAMLSAFMLYAGGVNTAAWHIERQMGHK